MNKGQHTTAVGLTATAAVAAALHGYSGKHGTPAAIALIESNRHTFARLLAGLPTRHATLVLAAQKLGVNLAGCLASPEPIDADDAAEDEATPVPEAVRP
jgi:hypothetical protein